MGKRNLYTYNIDFFKTPNLKNCYYAGLIASDGCIEQDNEGACNKLSIKIADDDKKVLEIFKHDIQFTGEIKFCKRARPQWKDMARLRITLQKQTENDLAIFGIVPNKTYCMLPPIHLQDEFALAYIIGLLDGDGSIYRTTDKYLRIKWTGRKDVLVWIKNIIDKKFPTEKGQVANIFRVKNEECFSYCIGGNRSNRIYQSLKKIDVPKFERKWMS